MKAGPSEIGFRGLKYDDVMCSQSLSHSFNSDSNPRIARNFVTVSRIALIFVYLNTIQGEQTIWPKIYRGLSWAVDGLYFTIENQD